MSTSIEQRLIERANDFHEGFGGKVFTVKYRVVGKDDKYQMLIDQEVDNIEAISRPYLFSHPIFGDFIIKFHYSKTLPQEGGNRKLYVDGRECQIKDGIIKETDNKTSRVFTDELTT